MSCIAVWARKLSSTLLLIAFLMYYNIPEGLSRSGWLTCAVHIYAAIDGSGRVCALTKTVVFKV